MAGGWNPWRALRARTHLTLRWAFLDEGCDGLLEEDGTLTIDARLGRRERSAVLAHELCHDERNIYYDVSTPAGLIQVEERAVDHEVARRLVPPVELDGWLAARGREPTTVADVVEEWDVATWVAERALRQAGQRRQAPGHPVFRGR